MTRLTFILRILIILLIPALPLQGADKYVPLPPALDGSMMPYDFTSTTQPPVIHDSLTPVYAAYVARHGARYLSGPAKMKPVMDALEEGVANGTLSATGEAFLRLMKEIEKANTGNWGDLSSTGIEEERELGRRMFATLPRLSREDINVNCISSFVPRAVMTMYQFSNQLIRQNDYMSVATDEGHKFSQLLYMFAYNLDYADYRKNGDWKHVYHEYVKHNVPVGPAERLFTRTSLSDKELRDLTVDMYEVLKANRAASLPAPTTQWMSVAEYTACWKASNLQHYLRNCVTSLSDAAAIATIPLLRKIIEDTDKSLENPSEAVALNGYFGHAETLLPLLSLIRVPECNDIRLDTNNLDRYWKVQDLVPLGANLLILVSRSNTGNHYVSMQLNGQTVNPIRGEGDIVSWDQLRTYWTEIINSYELTTRKSGQAQLQ